MFLCAALFFSFLLLNSRATRCDNSNFLVLLFIFHLVVGFLVIVFWLIDRCWDYLSRARESVPSALSDSSLIA